MIEEVEAIISKGDWEKMREGSLLGVNRRGFITIFSNGILHHEFGDNSEEEMVRIKISKIK